jgi:hypothetical protein
MTTGAAVSVLADTYTGYLADIKCVEKGTAADGANMSTNPEDHTVMCALMKPCIRSGYTLLVKNASGTYDSFPLDKRGNKMAVEYLRSTKKMDNILVNINGSMAGGNIQVESIEEVN